MSFKTPLNMLHRRVNSYLVYSQLGNPFRLKAQPRFSGLELGLGLGFRIRFKFFVKELGLVQGRGNMSFGHSVVDQIVSTPKGCRPSDIKPTGVDPPPPINFYKVFHQSQAQTLHLSINYFLFQVLSWILRLRPPTKTWSTHSLSAPRIGSQKTQWPWRRVEMGNSSSGLWWMTQTSRVSLVEGGRKCCKIILPYLDREKEASHPGKLYFLVNEQNVSAIYIAINAISYMSWD